MYLADSKQAKRERQREKETRRESDSRRNEPWEDRANHGKEYEPTGPSPHESRRGRERCRALGIPPRLLFIFV